MACEESQDKKKIERVDGEKENGVEREDLGESQGIKRFNVV